MAWTVRYRNWERGTGTVHDATLDLDWAQAAGVDPARLGTAEAAAWALAIILGANGNEEAELIAVTGMPMIQPRPAEPEAG